MPDLTMRNIHVKIFGLLFILLVTGACSSRVDRTIGEINILLDSLKSEYAPDTRIALWDLTVSGSKDLISLAGEVDNKAIYKAIVRTIDQKFPEVEITVLLLPEGGGGQLVNGLVNNSVANIRVGPSSRTAMETQALLGTPIRILKEENDWRLVKMPNGHLGWVNDSEVHFLEETELVRFRDAQKIIFTRQYGFSYSEPDETSLPVSDLVNGCLLPVISSELDFYQVEYPDGRLAWVKKDESTKAEDIFNKTTTAEGLVESLLKFHGIPYLWGGVSSKGVDCSGLASNVFFMNGILAPRDSDQQSLCGKEITTRYEYENLVTGDLLFFGRKASNDLPESVTHEAIYLGDSEFIHASGHWDRVSINSMDSTRDNYIESYPEIFVRAIRVIGETDNGFQPIMENDLYKEIIKITE